MEESQTKKHISLYQAEKLKQKLSLSKKTIFYPVFKMLQKQLILENVKTENKNFIEINCSKNDMLKYNFHLLPILKILLYKMSDISR